MFRQSSSTAFFLSNTSPEATILIEKHVKNRSKVYIWYRELGKDLLNYLERPEFIKVVLLEVSKKYGNPLMQGTAAEFAEALNSSQIQILLNGKAGMMLMNSVQVYLNPKNVSPFITTSADKFREMYMKIERVRIPVVVGDKRPYVGDMVAKGEDMGIDPSTSGETRIPFSNRFGSGHDGEHWLTNTVGAQVKATTGIKGLVLTHYFQEGGLGNVMILLENTKVVMLIKDLVTLGPKIKQAKRSYPDNPKTKINETMFTDKFGKPLDAVQLSAGDLIGTTMKWEKLGAKDYYLGYDRTFGTFHFAFLRYDIVQEYRSKVGHKSEKEKATGVADDELIATLPEDLKKKVIPLSWFIPVLSPESPIKCFRSCLKTRNKG